MTWRVSFLADEILLEFYTEQSTLASVIVSIGLGETSYAILWDGKYIPGSHDFQTEFAAASAEVVAAISPHERKADQ